MVRTGRPRSFDESEVVDAATEVFWQHGYGAASMRRVGERVGLLPGSLQAAFGDKRSLFLRSLEHYAQRQRAFGTSLQDPGPVLPRLRSVLQQIAAAASSDHPRGCMLGNTATELSDDPAATAIVRDALLELERSIAEALARAQREGEVAPAVEPEGAARMFVALMQGLHVLARVTPEPAHLRAAVDAALAPFSANP
ncbi:TetR/AcrR family transcriptional regulator [Actinotalea fermentans]|uniref:TetR family transcriptional regulator n=1 Tax=Actinotalea fermentans TaxID=43671 RepID=A0A511Z1Y3_9CELL|nr:TetR/AcrR family transcriptional regulator [Actinotalea fermentans]KGM17492.1 hypothetical protein N867_02430 [Actinotalea fermentans ATCC 43279 = JCM 9966 = DSM 3133]GEN81469.1 TetR family transcriptional regulator [Actinotalea fermentans]